ncbi:hypothetical protein MBELCI_0003 [Limimaricola cinnabarinus LL-001]|uniref:Uncharacterized protein n=2 Tax=Limimaricola cinnabarinus TaxID=1125964 RepID=U2YHH1_9RHOB|nr:hypothetical protein MBELCI_0003 [Limimaricola cinnabarinus LL-001]
MKEVQPLFEGDEPDPKLTRRSYELLQDRIADFAQRQGLDLQRGERRAAKERAKRIRGEAVCKRRNISPARGRELAAMEAEAAVEDRKEAVKERAAAVEDRKAAAQERAEAKETLVGVRAKQQAAEQARREAATASAALAAREQSLRIGTQAVIAEELTYSPPSAERPEGLTWGRNKPKSKKRREWLMEKIQPARDWIVGFARTTFGLHKRIAAKLAKQQARAAAIIDFEKAQNQTPPKSMLDIVNLNEAGPDDELRPIPGAWAVPTDFTVERLDEHLRGLTNTDICDAYAPTRDAADFAEHDDIQVRYRAGQHHLAEEAARRGLVIELREHHPGQATDAGRALLHTDSPPRALHVIRTNHARERRRGS